MAVFFFVNGSTKEISRSLVGDLLTVSKPGAVVGKDQYFAVNIRLIHDLSFRIGWTSSRRSLRGSPELISDHIKAQEEEQLYSDSPEDI